MRGPLQELFPAEHVYLAEMQGVGERNDTKRFTKADDLGRTVFTGGSGLRIPLKTSQMGSGGGVAESGTINVPSAMQYSYGTATLQTLVQPFSFSVESEEDLSDNSAMVSAFANWASDARVALATIENDLAVSLHAGTMATSGLLMNVSSNGGTGGLTVDVGTTANFDLLTPGRIVDVLTRSSGADPGNGLRRRIASFSESTGYITFDTAATASDGGSGNITSASTAGIYVPGTYGQGIQTLSQMVAATGTFQAINKATTAAWAGTDGRSGVTTSLPLSDAILATAGRVGRRSGTFSWDFGLGHPAVIDLYILSKTSQVRYDAEYAQLPSGFSGIVYNGYQKPCPMVKEPSAPRGEIKLIKKDAVGFIGRQKGPQFDDMDGSARKRFSRNLSMEVWLVDRVEHVAYDCRKLVLIDDLAES